MSAGSRKAAELRARAGFTLVEVLLVLLIMGGIMVSMTQILTAARNSRDTIHNIQETQNAGPAILDMIERDLRGLSIFDRTRLNHLRVKNRVILGFDADSLDFVSTTDSLVIHQEDDRFVRSDQNEVGYRLRPSPDNDQFLELYRRESFGIDDQPFEGGTFLFLYDRVKGLDIQCFKKDGPDEEPVDEWAAQEGDENIGLPARIEIRLTLELAPRLVNEQLRIAPIDRRTVVYKRVIRLPQALRGEEDAIPVPVVPQVPTAAPSNVTGGPATGSTSGGKGDGTSTGSTGSSGSSGQGRGGSGQGGGGQNPGPGGGH